MVLYLIRSILLVSYHFVKQSVSRLCTSGWGRKLKLFENESVYAKLCVCGGGGGPVWGCVMYVCDTGIWTDIWHVYFITSQPPAYYCRYGSLDGDITRWIRI